MVPSSSVLSELAERILIEHKAAEGAARSALEHAHAAGKLLLEAKEAVGHGHFGAWLANNFKRDDARLSDRTARAYMQVAKRWPELLEKTKRQHVADLSFRDALQLLAEPKPTELEASNGQTNPITARSRAAPRRLRQPPEQMAELCRNWWDIQAAYVVLLDVAGDDAESIALSLGIDVADVRKVLFPEPANRAEEFLLSNVPRLLTRYQATVESLIATAFTLAYSNAANHAHHEGLPELAAKLEALDRQAWRRWCALSGNGLPIGDWGDYQDYTDRTLPALGIDYGAAFWAGLGHCAITDFRVALGIQPDTGRSFLDTFTVGAGLRGAAEQQAGELQVTR